MKRLFTFMLLAVASFTIVGCDMFDEDPDLDDITISTSANIEDAHIDIDPSDTVIEGTDVTLSAPEVDGYVFDHWVDTENDDILSESNPYTFTAQTDMTIEAVYEADDNGENGDDAEQAAQAVIDDFDGDLSHMEAMVESFEDSDTLEMIMNVDMAIDDGEINETIALEIKQSWIESDDLKTQTVIDLDVPDVPDDVQIHVIVRETSNFYEAYVDIGFLLDMIEEAEDLDAREVFGFDSDILHVMVPDSMRDSFGELLNEALQEEFDNGEIDDNILEEVETTLETMIEYYDFAYLSSLDALEVDASIYDETDVLTEVKMTSDAMETMFTDMFQDLYPLIETLEDDPMPDYEEFIETDAYQEALDAIGELEPLELSMQYTPATEDTLHIDMDLLEFMNQLDENGLPNIQDLDVSITMHKDADIQIPEDARDLFELGEEFFMIAMLDESLHYASEVNDLALEDDTYTVQTIAEDYNQYFALPVLDSEQSIVSVNGDDISLDFVYENNGEDVFEAPVSLSTLEALGIDATEPPQSRDAFLDMLEPMNQDNIAREALIMDIIEMIVEDGAPQDPVDEEFPTEDRVQFDDISTLERPPKSIMSEAVQTQDDMVRYYHSELSTEEIFEFYQSALSDHDVWTITQADYVADESLGFFELSHNDDSASVVIEESSQYGQSTEVLILVEQEPSEETGDFPEDDLVDVPSFEYAVPRLEDSVVLEGFAQYNTSGRVFASQDSLNDIYAFYSNMFESVDAWEIESQSLNVDEGYGEIVAELESDHSIVAVTIEESDIYTDTKVIDAVFYSGE